MSGKKIRWERSHAQDNRVRFVQARNETQTLASIEMHALHDGDVELVGLLLTRALSAGMRAVLEEAREYLSRSPKHRLSIIARRKYQSWWARFIAGDKRGIAWEPKGWVERGETRRSFKPERDQGLPDWMRDPSLLPKKPPGRA